MRGLLIGTTATAAMIALVVPVLDFSRVDSVSPPPVAARQSWDGTHRIRVYATKMRPAVRQAAATLSQSTCLALQWSGPPETGRRAAPYEIVVRLVRDHEGPRARVSTAALPDRSSLRSVGIDINRAVLRQRPVVRKDIALHELGHGVGLQDSTSARSVMYPGPRKPYSRLSAGDRRSLRSVGGCGSRMLDCRSADASGIALGLHGSGGTGESFGEDLGWNEAAKRHGLIPLTPTAQESRSRNWDIRPGSPDAFRLLDLVQQTATDNCVDIDRIYVGGYSMGAMMASVLACTTRRFAAAAPVAGLVTPPEGCWPGTSLYAVHSTDDAWVTIQGDILPVLYPYLPTWAHTTPRLDSAAAWARTNDCSGSSASAGAVPASAHPETNSDMNWLCPQGVRVQVRIYDHIFHTVEPRWAERAMEFFDTVSR